MFLSRAVKFENFLLGDAPSAVAAITLRPAISKLRTTSQNVGKISSAERLRVAYWAKGKSIWTKMPRTMYTSICVATAFGSKSSDDVDKVLSWLVVSSRQVKPMTLEVFLSYTSLSLILTSSNTTQMYFCQS